MRLRRAALIILAVAAVCSIAAGCGGGGTSKTSFVVGGAPDALVTGSGSLWVADDANNNALRLDPDSGDFESNSILLHA